MKKLISKILKFFGKFFRILYRIIDLLLITPISKGVYWLFDGINSRNGGLDKFLNNPNTLVYISLFFAVIAFFAVDLKVVNFSETEAIVLSRPVACAVPHLSVGLFWRYDRNHRSCHPKR